MQGLWWPDDVGEKWQHALKHVSSIEVGIEHCTTRRTAIQAGGNVGLWPRRLAETFTRVFTFEPDDESRRCLVQNVPSNVMVSALALGTHVGRCGFQHRSLGSHRVVEGGAGVGIMPIDDLGLYDVDFIQLDIEGYEYHALMGALRTIRSSHPVIQVELRGFTEHFGRTDDDVLQLLRNLGYRQVATAPGSDFIFRHGGK